MVSKEEGEGMVKIQPKESNVIGHIGDHLIKIINNTTDNTVDAFIEGERVKVNSVEDKEFVYEWNTIGSLIVTEEFHLYDPEGVSI